jgi:sigma-B regulation protein RsbU (phosphoserine phosphatase)
MPRATLQYIVLAMLFACAAAKQTGEAWSLMERLRHAATLADEPVPLAAASRIVATGPFRNDQLLAIDGHPLESYNQYRDAVRARRPGDRMRLTLSEPSGTVIERDVEISSEKTQFGRVADIAVAVCLDLVIPMVALGLGFAAAFIRPRDRSAWLLLILMMGFAQLSRSSMHWLAPGANEALIWEGFWNAWYPTGMLLFGIYFPNRLELDRRDPWLKYLFIVPSAIGELAYWSIVVVWTHDINAALPFRPFLVRLSFADMIFSILGVTGFFVALGYKARKDPSADARRRLRILHTGALISLFPVLLLVLYSLFRQTNPLQDETNLLQDVPWPIAVTALLFLALFPLTLAYVIVVERAMDLRFVIRQSLQYGLARGGLFVARGALLIFAIYLFSTAATSRRWAELVTVGIALIVVRRRSADRATQWVDKKFFREAYDSERVLHELATEAGRYVELEPLLAKVAGRISETMHVPDIVILVREGDRFIPRYSTRPGEPMNIGANSRIVRNLQEGNQALNVYFDKPPVWIRSLDAEELQTLDHMRSQLLLPLAGQEQLAGILSLGPKLSEAPYSEVDIRLLQAVASQMGLALENSRLVASLAAAAAERERANTELEIAREVQERLFPQKFPAIPGLDCAGYCRPARGVGGDYYDFLHLADGRLGIAIGDVSGKGIAAALLMASLQASLRGQALAEIHDLSALMHNVNKLVYEASTSSRYATFFYGEYDSATRRLNFVNAGHNPPVILRGASVLRLEAGGPVVGLLPQSCYAQDCFVFEPGDIFIAFTDGISEALNEREEEWEEDRFIAASAECRRLDAKHMIEAIFAAADGFTGAAKQYDDMTLLIVKVAG